jgi:O-antigen/teichoic acid export membrane protein
MLKKPLVNTLVQIFGKGVTILISLFTTGILTRRLGPSVYGSYTLVSSVFIILDSLADFGTKIIGVREASLKEGKEREKIFTQVTWLRLLMSTIAFLLGLGLIFTWSGFADIRLESVVSLSMIWFTSIAGSLEIVFQTKLRMDLKVIIDIIFPLIFLIALFWWNKPISLLWIFSTYLIARILSLIIGVISMKNSFKFFGIKLINWQFVKKFLKEAWPMGVYLIIFSGYDRAADSLLIQRFIGVRELAFYGLAYKIYGNLIQPAYFFVNSIFPLMSAKSQGKRKLFKESILLLLAGLALLIPFIYILAPWIIRVLAGVGFEASATVLRILLLALIFSYGGHLFGFTLIAQGGQKEILRFSLVSLIFNIAGNIYAIPRFGIVGAAVVTVITEAVNCILMGWRLWRKR